jgi:hypothetical protein
MITQKWEKEQTEKKISSGKAPEEIFRSVGD